MPAFGVNHQDPEIQDIVAFVRHLPSLTAAEKQELWEALPHEHHHEAGGHEEAEGHEAPAAHEHAPGTPPHHHRGAAASRRAGRVAGVFRHAGA